MASRYTQALVCRVPDSFVKAIGADGQIDIHRARLQHATYIETLRQCGLDVIEMEADEELPDCSYVEDTCVVIGSTALLLRPGHPSRRKEVAVMRGVLQQEFPNLHLMEVTDDHARIDGGDVLFTGLEIFVGLSHRTNMAGAAAVAGAFPDYAVTPIKTGKVFHLKCAVTMAGPQIFAVGSSPEAQDIVKRIEKESTYRYQTITVPDDRAANGVFVNGTFIHQSDFPDSTKVLETVLPFQRCPIEFSEFNKASGSLSCCSILLSKAAVDGR